MTASLGFCQNEDVGEVMRFIRDHWKEDHVLATHRGLFDWQYRNHASDRYNFVLGRRDSDGELLGVLGFIPTERYDPSLANDSVVWLALWKVRADAGITGLGMFLHRYLVDHTDQVCAAVSGLNKVSHRVMAGLGYQPEILDHYYLLNPTIKTFHLAHVPEPPSDVGPLPLETSLEPANSELLLSHSDWAIGDRTETLPAKSATYFLHRFIEHPYYDYAVYAVRDKDQLVGLMAVRPIEHDGVRALRIVDYWGSMDGLRGLGGALQSLVVASGAEYIDCVCWGLPEEVMIGGGFARLDIAADTIIPHYFEPFERSNVPTRAAFKAPPGKSFLFFKADGDQDRPNQLPT